MRRRNRGLIWDWNLDLSFDTLPELRILGSTFFDPDTTYMSVLQDLSLLLAIVCFNWGIDDDDAKALSVTPRSRGISESALILFALAYSCRLVEFFPFDHLFYDVATCVGFAILFWISLVKAMHSNSKTPTIADIASRQRDDKKQGFILRFTVIATAAFAYVFNYSHLQLTPKLFCFAWGHYLEAIAMVPQFIGMYNLMKRGFIRLIPRSVWVGTLLVAVSRIFQILNWAYLWQIVELWDQVGVVSAFLHLMDTAIFLVVVGVVQAQRWNKEFKPHLQTKTTESETDTKPKKEGGNKTPSAADKDEGSKLEKESATATTTATASA